MGFEPESDLVLNDRAVFGASTQIEYAARTSNDAFEMHRYNYINSQY